MRLTQPIQQHARSNANSPILWHSGSKKADGWIVRSASESCAAIQVKSEYQRKKRRNSDLVEVKHYTLPRHSLCAS
jgi:hypothetical protein